MVSVKAKSKGGPFHHPHSRAGHPQGDMDQAGFQIHEAGGPLADSELTWMIWGLSPWRDRDSKRLAVP